MAPENKTRKSKAIPAAKPASGLSKRKAVEDTSPIAIKKSKSTKGQGRPTSSKSAQTSASNKKAQRSIGEEDSQASAEDEDHAQALAQILDSGEEDDAPTDTETAQELSRPPNASTELAKASKSDGNEPGVVYIGRIPHGFYEKEMRAYFSQFGQINKLRMSRNKATGRSKHFGFIEFAEVGVAQIVAKTMDNYLLAGHLLKVKLVPKSQIHPELFKGGNRRFKKIPWNKMAGNQLKKPLSQSAWTDKIAREEQRRSERSKKLAELDYEFDGPKLKAVENASQDAGAIETTVVEETTKTISAVPGDVLATEVYEEKVTTAPEETVKASKKTKTKPRGEKAKTRQTKKA
ncbi:hypothetical protein GGR56DRAFT_634182 [Xylariaceae sp. FL0804]|nr:hypothetical protein GGR56DRAFT_634182 [Xylariaceae sp. FL0804]